MTKPNRSRHQGRLESLRTGKQKHQNLSRRTRDHRRRRPLDEASRRKLRWRKGRIISESATFRNPYSVLAENWPQRDAEPRPYISRKGGRRGVTIGAVNRPLPVAKCLRGSLSTGFLVKNTGRNRTEAPLRTFTAMVEADDYRSKTWAPPDDRR